MLAGFRVKLIQIGLSYRRRFPLLRIVVNDFLMAVIVIQCHVLAGSAFSQTFAFEGVIGTNLTFPSISGEEVYPARLAFPPFDTHLETATGHQPGNRTCGPFCRKGRKNEEAVVVALKEHLGDAGRTAEITINLEGRMGIEKIGVGAAYLFGGSKNQEGIRRQG